MLEQVDGRLGLEDWVLVQVDVDAGTEGLEAEVGGLDAGAGGLDAGTGGCGCWRLEFGNLAASGICIKIVRD